MSSIAAHALIACVVCAGCGRVSFDDVILDAASDDASTGPLLVQEAGQAAVNVTTLSVALSSDPRAHDMLVLVGGGHIGQLLQPTGGSAVWTRAIYSAVHPNVEIWFGIADGTRTITIEAFATTGMSLWVGDWTGLALTDTLDDASAAGLTTSPASAGSITISATPELVIFAVNSYLPNTFGIPTGGTWTEVDTQIGDSMQRVWFDVATTVGDVAPVVDETQHRWDAAIAGFRTR